MDIRTSSMSTDKKNQFYSGKYHDFKMTFPKLYEAALNPSFPLEFFDMMLKQRDNLRDKVNTVDDADRIVYDTLREKYVTPIISTTSNNV